LILGSGWLKGNPKSHELFIANLSGELKVFTPKQGSNNYAVSFSGECAHFVSDCENLGESYWVYALDTKSVNYPALTGGALGFPVAFTAHLHLPFGVSTHPRPVSLVKARAMFTDSNRGKRECEIVFFLNNQRMVKVLSWLFMFFCSLAGSK